MPDSEGVQADRWMNHPDPGKNNVSPNPKQGGGDGVGREDGLILLFLDYSDYFFI